MIELIKCPRYRSGFRGLRVPYKVVSTSIVDGDCKTFHTIAMEPRPVPWTHMHGLRVHQLLDQSGFP